MYETITSFKAADGETVKVGDRVLLFSSYLGFKVKVQIMGACRLASGSVWVSIVRLEQHGAPDEAPESARDTVMGAEKVIWTK